MIDKRTDVEDNDDMVGSINDAYRSFLEFLSGKVDSGEISEKDFDEIVDAWSVPLRQAGVEIGSMDEPLPGDEVAVAARRHGLHLMKQKLAELYPSIRFPESRER